MTTDNTPTDSTVTGTDDNSRGIAFGTSVAYDDAYAYADVEKTTEVVDDDDMDMDDDTDDVDTGRIAAHPSTLAGQEDTNVNTTNNNNMQQEYHGRRHNREVQEDGMSFKDAILLKELDREKAELEKELVASHNEQNTTDQTATTATATATTTSGG